MKRTPALLTIALILLCLCACTRGHAAAQPTEPTPTPAAEEPEEVFPPRDDLTRSAAATGEIVGAGCMEPVAELFPDDGYERTLEGYKAYAIDALRQDEHAPEDIVETTVEDIHAADDGEAECFSILIDQGRILPYDQFMA